MFVKTITLNLLRSDLKDFYVSGDRMSVEDTGFQKFLRDAFSDAIISRGEEVTYNLHTTTATANDRDIMENVGEKIIDLSTAEGKAEARRRLNVLKHLIREHQKEKQTRLLDNGYRNAIGWFKLESGSYVAVGCYYFAGGHQWRCITWPFQQRSAGGYYFSADGKADK